MQLWELLWIYKLTVLVFRLIEQILKNTYLLLGKINITCINRLQQYITCYVYIYIGITVDSKLSMVMAKHNIYLFRAGSRNESGETMGATHVLRVAAGGTTQRFSKFAIARQVAQAGAILTCTTDREVVAYTLEGTRRAVQDTIPILSAVATEQLFYPWEISENDNRLRLELATRPPQVIP